MAGKMGKFVIIFFVAAICLTSMVSAVYAEINPTIQVGLFYGQNALPGANLENYTGTAWGILTRTCILSRLGIRQRLRSLW